MLLLEIWGINHTAVSYRFKKYWLGQIWRPMINRKVDYREFTVLKELFSSSQIVILDIYFMVTHRK